MEIRIYIPINNNNTPSKVSYHRTEGGFWFTETIGPLRRTFQVKDRLFLNKKDQGQTVVEILEEEDPDYVSLPCWPLPAVQWSKTEIQLTNPRFSATVEHFPEFNVVRFSPVVQAFKAVEAVEAVQDNALQPWLADISLVELTSIFSKWI